MESVSTTPPADVSVESKPVEKDSGLYEEPGMLLLCRYYFMVIFKIVIY